MDPLHPDAITGLAASRVAVEAFVDEHGPVAVVDLRASHDALDLEPLAGLPLVTVAMVGAQGPATSQPVDVTVRNDIEACDIVERVRAAPIASVALVLHLRATEASAIDAALVAESATYSTLQAGPEHAAWLAERGEPRRRADDGERVRVAREPGRITITLSRPAVRNAFDAAMREALRDALLVAADSDDEVVLMADGAAFSSGGDLDEFGSLADPASAHLLRVSRSPALELARLADRTTVLVHGACYGAGVELPAFAHRVIARPDTTFTLPEVAMGLIPGAGGTVSIPRRIGRHRTAWLALTGNTVDAATALEWGLVDEIAG